MGGGWTASPLVDPFLISNPATGSRQVDLLSGGSVANVDFALRSQAPNLGAIAGVVFSDPDINGSIERDSDRLPDRVVYVDLNNNFRRDVGESWTKTYLNGSYRIDLPPGQYKVRRELPSGYYLTTPSAAFWNVTVTKGEFTDEVDFGAARIPVRRTLRINAGGGEYQTADGKIFDAEQGFSGGMTSQSPFEVGGTVDDPMYFTRRFGKNFGFSRSVGNGNYTLYLNFAESFHTSAGKRKFDVFAEGKQIIDDLDLVNVVGAKRAYTRAVNISVTDGTLNLSFVGVVGDAIISSIGLIPR